MIYAVFATHVLLDSMTVYGTQIFWPLSDTPVGLGSIFIIDPAYTLPMVIGVIAVLIVSRDHSTGYRWNITGLVISTVYLAWTATAQWYMTDVARRDLAEQGISHQRLLVQPTPFNSILWRALAMDGDSYFEGYRSMAVTGDTFQFKRYDHSPELLDDLSDHWPVKRLLWFSKGFISTKPTADGRIVMSDLRMGLEPDYVFRFVVGALGNPHPQPVAVERIRTPRNYERLPDLWDRIWSESGDFTSAKNE